MVENHRCSGSTKDQRPSNLGNTRAGHSIFRMLVDLTTCKCGTPTPDGSRPSDSMVPIS